MASSLYGPYNGHKRAMIRLFLYSIVVAPFFMAHGFVLRQESVGFARTTGHARKREGSLCDVSAAALATRPSSPSPLAGSSSPAISADSAVESGNTLCSLFRHSSTVYIEMTDMYGIVYHANYITYARRAIEHAFGAPGVRFHGLFSMKYRAAATLGEEVVVQGSLVSCDSEGKHSLWRFELTDAADQSRVFVSAEAVISWPGGVALPPGTTIGPPSSVGPRAMIQTDTQLLQPLPEAFVHTPKTLEVVVWSDDLDGGGELSIRSVLNYFERLRTLSLGRGPDGELGLVRLYREGVSIVVTNIPDLRVQSQGVAAGDTLNVRLGAKLSRGNRVMTMYQTLWKQDETLVAHAEIALFCMDNESRRFRSVPSWVQEILVVPSTAVKE